MTELIWGGKYKDDKKVTPVRISLPFQTIETVNESAQQRERTLDFFVADPSNVYSKEWRNRLIWGDKKYVLPSLLPECIFLPNPDSDSWPFRTVILA